ncbi:MAG: hypothetical protein WCG48_03025 [Candidatus Berkelbacteria bacterium]
MREASWKQVTHLVENLMNGESGVIQWLTENWDLVKILMSVADPKMISREKLSVFLAGCAKSTSKLFVFVKDVELDEIPEFIPKDKFKVTKPEDREKARVVVGYVDNEIWAILGGDGCVNSAEEKVTIRINRIVSSSYFSRVWGKFDGNFLATFGRAWQMVELQGRGEDGDLLVNSRSNLFPIKGTNQVLSCLWDLRCRHWIFAVYRIDRSAWTVFGDQWITIADSGS